MAATVADVTAAVTRAGRRGKSKAKQTDLPSMENHQRRIAEIEDLADIEQETNDELTAAKEKHNDAMENLVASMKRHDKTFYERQTWGKVVLKESKTKARVTKATVKPTDSEDADEGADE